VEKRGVLSPIEGLKTGHTWTVYGGRWTVEGGVVVVEDVDGTVTVDICARLDGKM